MLIDDLLVVDFKVGFMVMNLCIDFVFVVGGDV